MNKKIFLVLLLGCSFINFAQIGGEYTYQFLNLVSSPREAAMGGKVLTNTDWDTSQFFHNPSTINLDMDKQLALNFVNYFADVNYGSVAYSRALGAKKHLLAVGVTYIDYGTFDGYDEFKNATGEFSGNEFALTLGYNYNIPNSNLYLGANAKFISSKMEVYNSIGGAVDLAARYQFKKSNSTLTLVANNLGGQFTAYDIEKERIPFHIDLSYAKVLKNLPLKWHVVFENLQQWDIAFENPSRSTVDLDGNETSEEINFFNHFIRHLVVGAELFHGKAINLRFGYNFRRGEELKVEENRVFAGLTAGFGVKLKRFRVNYAYQKFSTAATAHTFGLNINLQ